MSDPARGVGSKTFIEVRRSGPDWIGIAGWALHRDHGAVIRFDVEVPHGRGRVSHLRVGLPSEDVARALPGNREAERCRFELMVETDRDPAESLVLVRPLFGAHGGGTIALCTESLQPPAELIARVGGSWEVGVEWLGHLIDLAGLEPGSRVLDVGCGVGRMAAPLQRFLGRGDPISLFKP